MRIQNPTVFHLIQNLAVILTLSFIQKTKTQKLEWLEIVSTSAPQSEDKFGWLPEI